MSKPMKKSTCVKIDYEMKDGRFPYDNVMVAEKRYHLIFNKKPQREYFDF